MRCAHVRLIVFHLFLARPMYYLRAVTSSLSLPSCNKKYDAGFWPQLLRCTHVRSLIFFLFLARPIYYLRAVTSSMPLPSHSFCVVRMYVHLYFFCFSLVPSTIFALLLLPCPSLVATPMPSYKAGSSPPSPLRYAPSFVSREGYSIFFPRRLASLWYPRYKALSAVAV